MRKKNDYVSAKNKFCDVWFWWNCHGLTKQKNTSKEMFFGGCLVDITICATIDTYKVITPN